jgi:hypothetical protein
MGKEEDALKELAAMFPAVDAAFLEDVFVSSNKNVDKTGTYTFEIGSQDDKKERE